MRVVIDCFKLVKGNGKSIGIYNLALNLARNLAATKSDEDEIVVLGTKKNASDFGVPGVRFVYVPYNPEKKIVFLLWELFLVSIALRKIKPDKVVFPRGFAPLFHVCEEYVIIHDMIPFYYHENYPGVLPKLENAYIMWRLKASAKKVTGVFTVSEASKRDIVKYAKIGEKKIKVIYSGQNKLSLHGKQIKKNYISAMVSALPHKNAEKVLKSYVKYFEKVENPKNLYMIGIENSMLDQLCSELTKEIKSHITCHKFFEKDEDMQEVVMNSNYFLFLSRKEGFGFPPLEAMQMGVPVICSNASSLPEVVGNAAILVSPEDEEAVAEAMIQMEREGIAEKYIKLGYENVKKFLWADKINEYKDVLGLK